MGRGVRIGSPAKINLGLEIAAKRPDGFHELLSVMSLLDLTDQLTVFEDDGEHDDDLPGVPGRDNLIRRALDAFRAIHPDSAPLGWTIEKRIPAAAGLGGASSNAAAALLAANSLADTPLPSGTLHRLAASLGSDIPFFLNGPAGLASGRGTEIAPLPPIHGWLVIVVPERETAAKTASMYGKLITSDFSDGAAVAASAAAIRNGGGVESLHLHNSFTRAARAQWPEVDRVLSLFPQLGIERHGLSGAGPSTYALLKDRNEAELLERRLRSHLSDSTLTIVTSFRQTPLMVEEISPGG